MGVTAKRPRHLKSWMLTWVVVAVVLLALVAVFAGILATGTEDPSSLAANATTVALRTSPALLREVTGLNLGVANSVGVTSPATSVTPPLKIAHQQALVSQGRPELLYVGAEFCPFCAAERWPLAVALGRFGTFTKLDLTTSAPSPEVFPLTPTFTFYQSTYTSKYVTFVAVETETRTHQPLMPLTYSESALVSKYDLEKYLPVNGPGPGGSIPFLDVGNRFLQAGASYTPALLAGLSQSTIAKGLNDATNPVTEAIVTSANYLTADICALTHELPAQVCVSSGVKAADRKSGLHS
jgi:thiol-disulfide isomerase/thioredoxin